MKFQFGLLITGAFRGEITALADDSVTRDRITGKIVDLVRSKVNLNAVEAFQVDDVNDLGKVKEDVFLNLNPEMFADQFAKRFRTEIWA